MREYTWILLVTTACSSGPSFESATMSAAGSAGAAGSSGAAGSTSGDAGGTGGTGGTAGGAAGWPVADGAALDAGEDVGAAGTSTTPDAAQDYNAPEVAPDAPDVPDAAPDVVSPPDAAPDTVCVPGTCASLGKDCGSVNNGCGGTISCGSCAPNMSCGGGGTPNVCGGCVPITCASVPQYCGLLEDGCGNTLDCGPYKRGSYDPVCQDYPGHPYSWYCIPEQYPAPPPFATGCVVRPSWPGAFCCTQSSL